MYKHQTSSVALRTGKMLEDAFLTLIRDREYEDISVSEICARADVVRKTFYNHFQSKDDVVLLLIHDFASELESMVDVTHMSVRQMLLIAFRTVLENREMLLLFHDRGLFRFAHKSITEYITKSSLLKGMSEQIVDKRINKYIAAQIPAVLISVIETWIYSGLEETAEFLAELTEQLIVSTDFVLEHSVDKPKGEACDNHLLHAALQENHSNIEI